MSAANALPLLGIITHLNREVKPWENLVVAVYFLQPEAPPLPEHAAYLTQLATPAYRTLPGQHSTPGKKATPYYNVFEETDRVIAIDEVDDEPTRQNLVKYYGKYEMQIGGRRLLKVPDDGIYDYLYQVEVKEWLVDDAGHEWLEFVINRE